MKIPKYILLALAIFFAAASVWMKATGYELKGTGRPRGTRGQIPMTNIDALILAGIFAFGYIKSEIDDRKNKS